MYRPTYLAVAVLAVLAAGCDAMRPTEPHDPSFSQNDAAPSTLAGEVKLLAASRGIGALPPAPVVRQPLVRLGRALAFDKILSGNRDISCMSCHLPRFATGDAKSLSIGQGGSGFGPSRTHRDGVFIPRNAPPLFNLDAMRNMFWDGRVEVDASGDLHTPAGAHITPEMKRVFEFGAVSAIAMFPVTNREEMRAASGNELAVYSDDDFTGIWRGLMARLGEIPQYRAMFESAYPGTKFQNMTFAHASNAIGAFLTVDLRSDGSPWDQFLAGKRDAMTDRQLEGAKTFMTLKCSICHSGATFSDQDFHNVAVAQIGPGRGDGADGHDDFGRGNVTGRESDRYRFRTTPLRNVELTAPFGHDGAIVNLREFIEHYSESDLKLLAFTTSALEPLLQGTLQPNASAILATRDTLLQGVVLPDALVDGLMDFMSALTDPGARNLRYLTPTTVPSGLSIDR